MHFTLLCQELNHTDVTQNVTLVWSAMGGGGGRNAVQVGPPVILKTVHKQLHAPQPGSLS
jgi:hypothetical protein